MASKRSHPHGPEDHKSKQDPPTKAENTHKTNRQTKEQPGLEHQHTGDTGKMSPVEIDADSSRGDPPHGYGTEAPQVQGGGKR